jgi:hypothetical protein
VTQSAGDANGLIHASQWHALSKVAMGSYRLPCLPPPHTHTQVAAASSATMILFTAASACCVYLHFGIIAWDYAAPLAALGFAATLAGQAATHRVVQLVGRRSIIVFSMTALMALSGCVMYYQSGLIGWEVAQQRPEAQELRAWGSICPAKGSASGLDTGC